MAGTVALTTYFWSDMVARPAWQQMAIDHALLEFSETDAVVITRVYRWLGDSISFGANESARRRWSRERIECARIPVVRRPTGGRAVWHDASDLTYAMAGALSTWGSARDAYRTIHDHLATAFRQFGTATMLAPAPVSFEGLRPGACFDQAVGGEVLWGGRKAVGSAQRTTSTSLLQHGEIARADRRGPLARFRLDNGEEPPESAEVVDLPPADVLARALRDAALEGGSIPMPAELVDSIERHSLRHAEQYRDPAWTWRR